MRPLPAAVPNGGRHQRGRDLGWRIAFGLGAILGIGILFVRKNVPEAEGDREIDLREGRRSEPDRDGDLAGSSSVGSSS